MEERGKLLGQRMPWNRQKGIGPGAEREGSFSSKLGEFVAKSRRDGTAVGAEASGIQMWWEVCGGSLWTTLIVSVK